MAANCVRHVLTILEKEWSGSENTQANKAAKLLQLVMPSKNKEIWHLPQGHCCQPPQAFETKEATRVDMSKVLQFVTLNMPTHLQTPILLTTLQIHLQGKKYSFHQVC